MAYRFWVIGLCLMLGIAAWANDTTKVKTPIYQGVTIKLDIASPIVVAAVHKWKMQHYELAANVRLKDRYYPTMELGYAGGQTNKGDTLFYNGQGGFVRIGCDINPLRKSAAESPHALLIGVRVGTAIQNKWETDCWGEIVAGCQVEIAKVNKTAFYMGWQGRFKVLFTREKEGQHSRPIYIPGFGSRDNIGWGVSYHLGWKF